MINLTSEQKEKYIDWVCTDCSSIADEIAWLLDCALSENPERIKDVTESVLNVVEEG